MTLALALLVCGCSVRMLDFTLLSSKNVEMRIPPEAKGKRVTGTDMVVVVLLPFGIPNLKEAVDRAIESAGPGYDALIDGVVYNEQYAFLIGQVGYKVEGTPVKTGEVRAAALMRGEDPEVVLRQLLRHSPRGVSNEEAIQPASSR
ncbi:MAG TPA: hypothetical protein VMW56_01890 [Candidatus Margulisiibacteriota bacterium]|nr:hypothetical protein [Candidatus Margulisiibacteriota bacterium]